MSSAKIIIMCGLFLVIAGSVACSNSDSPAPAATTTSTTTAAPAPTSTPEPVADKVAPYVTGTTPTLGSKGAAQAITITAQLSEPIACKTITTQSVQVNDSAGNDVAGGVSCDPLGLSVQFVPNNLLSNDELYTVTLSTAITDVAGNAMTYSYAWSFEVVPAADPPPPPPLDLKPPYVVATSPTLGAVAVALSSAITATFSEALADSSITAQTVTVVSSNATPVAGTISVIDNGTTIQFKPNSDLQDSDTYTIKLDTGITDAAGNPLTSPYTFTIKTNSTKTVFVTSGSNSTLALKENGALWGWGQNNFGQLGDGSQVDRNHPSRTLIPATISTVTTAPNDPYASYTTVAQGSTFSIALDTTGHVWTWGDNRSGQLGDGTTTMRLTPVMVPGLSNVQSVAAGASFALALKTDGSLWAWGLNSSGQLGNGIISATLQTSPQQVQGLTGTIKSIVTTGSSVAALIQSDLNNIHSTSMWVWGSNISGQLGTGNTANSAVPLQLKLGGVALSDITMIAGGDATFAALTVSGDLYIWGSNRYGQVGNAALTIGNNNASSMATAPYLAMKTITAVYMGPTSRIIMAKKDDGTLWGWGDDNFGQLATQIDTGTRTTPLKLGTISNMVAISGSKQNAAFLQNDGTAFMTGYNVNGELGDGTASFVPYRPYYISNMPSAKSVSSILSPTGYSGKDSGVIAAQDGTVWAWGSNQWCEMSIASKVGQVAPIMIPTQVAPNTLVKIIQVSRGVAHVLALTDTGEVYAWGDNSLGQLGNNQVSGTSNCVPTKVLSETGVGTLSGVTSIATGFNTAFALKKDPVTQKTTVYAWGANNRANLALGFSSAPKPLPTLTVLPDNVKKIASGSSHSLAVTDSGVVYGWGNNNVNQAGDSASTNDVVKPNPIVTATDGPMGPASDVCTGAFHSVILRQNGTVVSWGNNPGYLGTTDHATTVKIPSPVTNVTNATQIACNGGRTTLAMTSDGHLWSWGQNPIGEMGQGTTILYADPLQVPDPKDLSSMFGDIDTVSFNFVIRKDGTSWGLGFLPDGEIEYVSHLVTVTYY